jgi:hypothetical protein
MREIKNAYNIFGSGNLKNRFLVGELGVVGRIINWI